MLFVIAKTCLCLQNSLLFRNWKGFILITAEVTHRYLEIGMTDYYSSSSSAQATWESTPGSLQSLKITPKEKTGSITDSNIATAASLNIRLPQVNVLGCETYQEYKRKKWKAHKAIQTDLKKETYIFGLIVFSVQHKCWNLFEDFHLLVGHHNQIQINGEYE